MTRVQLQSVILNNLCVMEWVWLSSFLNLARPLASPLCLSQLLSASLPQLKDFESQRSFGFMSEQPFTR